MEVTERRRSSTDRAVVEAILTPDNAIQPPPAERIGQVHNGGSMFPPPKPSRGHTRPLSFAARSGNRLSLSFPIQLPGRERGGSTGQTPTSSTSTTSQQFPSAEAATIPSPKDSAGFMEALAAQERRVLELKEELNRAEGDLKKLKRQWALHEGSKKRAEIKHTEQLRPIQIAPTGINLGSSETEEAVAIRRSTEMDRRKALLATVAKDSRRKIITGGHTRTLSLLSPDRSSYDGYASPASALNSDTESLYSNPAMPRSTTMPDTSQNITRVNSDRIRHSYHDSATNGVKQIAEDLKAGLWTFMEDLRQATVGEEAIKDPAAQSSSDSMSGKSLSHKRSKGSLVGGELESNRSHLRSKSASSRSRSRDNSTRAKNQDIGNTSKLKAAKSKTQTPQSAKLAVATSGPAELDDDDWANWDSPISKSASPRWSNSTTLSQDTAGTPGTTRFDHQPSPLHNAQNLLIDNSSPSNDSNARRNDVYVDNISKRDSIPWPALNNLTPSNLKRTASTIMKEWEKSLTPPADSRVDPLSSSAASKRLESDHEARLLLNNFP
jgi:hypothetical protein